MRGKQADVYIRTACFFAVMIPGMERGEPIDHMDKRSIWIRENNRCLRIQDHIAWREINYSMLQTISADFPGIVIVPMTIVNPLYFNELVGKLRAYGVKVNHYTLLAERETLLKRLKSRGDHSNSWPGKQVDACIASLSQSLFETHIHTDSMKVDDIVEHIAKQSDIPLSPDHRGIMKKRMDRFATKIRRVRF